MIAFLHGVLAARTSQSALIEVAGVGYEVLMSQDGLSKLPAVGHNVEVLTYLQVSENALVLYGFLTEDEKSLFEQLITVSGVGPKMALAALSVFSPQDLAAAIVAQDVTLVSRIPGVGKKTASRIILELKGSLDQGIEGDGAQDGTDAAAHAGRSGVLEALLSMGFTSSEADLALKGAPQGAGEQELLQYALRRLGS